MIRPQSDKRSLPRSPPTLRARLAGLVKADAVEEVRETRVAAHRIKERMYFQPLQNAFPFAVRSLKPHERLVIVAEREVRVNKRGSLDVACLPTFLQFIYQAKCFGAVSGARGAVASNSRAPGHCGALGRRSFRDRESPPPPDHWHRERQEQVRDRIVRMHRQRASQLPNGIGVAARLKKKPADTDAGIT